MIYQRFGKWWGRFSLIGLQLVNFLTARLRPKRMTRTVRASLLALRGYFLMMLFLVPYRVAGPAGIPGR